MITEKGNEYSLWLIPENGARDRFTDIIQELSRTYHTKLFDPHITLAGGINGSETELTAKAENLSTRLSRLTVIPQEVKYLNEFYRSLFLLVTPDEPLINANKLAKELFGLPSDEYFMPHLSLLYGTLAVKEKEKIIEKLESKRHDPFYVNNIVLFCTCNHPDKWYSVKSFPLARND